MPELPPLRLGALDNTPAVNGGIANDPHFIIIGAFPDRGTNHYGHGRIFNVSRCINDGGRIILDVTTSESASEGTSAAASNQSQQNAKFYPVRMAGLGKTSLIKALTHDSAAEPDTAGPFKIYKHVEELGNESSGIERTNLYFADYRWQNLTYLIGGFLLEQKQPYCQLRYGFLNSLIIVVDVTDNPKYHSEIVPKAQSFSQKRVEDNLTELNSQSIQAILGLFTRPQLKYICLFINKIDLLIGYDEAMENEIKKAYLPLLHELNEARGRSL